MHFIVRLLSTLAGVMFAMGGAAKLSAQEFRPSTLNTAVIARQNPTMTSTGYEMERNRFVRALAAMKDVQPAKPRDTKPTKKTKSPTKYW